ncbi:MAG: hypothetical protein QOI35_2841 [Cryptosporangiaceae bacterium]|jgi:hypothetical protein|nr:hypothetical protein [Cryptosporangiaceae bacterium]MDQ1657052.1 hypothetical protein [Cryptosporangiaceae bacterium]
MSTGHASERLLARYAEGDNSIPGDQLWAIEAHLETCADCRSQLTAGQPLLDAVWAGLEPELRKLPGPPRHRWRAWLATWASPATLSWLTVVVVTALLAAELELVRPHHGSGISLVLLVAPLLPIAAVYASWSRGLDPAYEVVIGTPRAGLYLVLRRTVAVLAAVIPALTFAGWATGTSIALVLLPSLAFTTATLALGSAIGVRRAAVALTVLWSVTVVAPGIAWDHVPFAFGPDSPLLWAGALVAGALAVFLRRASFARLGFARD